MKRNGSRTARGLSVVVPTLNEADGVRATLVSLQPLRERGHEVILSDGGSTDDTVSVARPWVDEVVVGPAGRARQMNAGAAQARGEVLLFLHADTLVPPGADTFIAEGLRRSGRRWGRFDLRLSSRHWALRVLERTISWRSRLTGIATGDQAIFVERALFESEGGFEDIPLMEDVRLTASLRSTGRPLCLREKVVTSSRRWEERGITRTILLMWRLRLEHALGADPGRLHRIYRRS